MNSIDNYKIGQKDTNGNIITKIFSKGDSFVIYEIKSNIQSDSLKVMINPYNKPEYVEI